MAWPRAKVTIQRLTGGAVGKIPSPTSSAPKEDRSAQDSPSSSATPVMAGTVAEEIAAANQLSMTSAEPTISPLPDSMDWTVSPIIFVENGLAANIAPEDLKSLPERVLQKLSRISEGTGDPISSIIQQISEFFMEEEDERSEGTLEDALEFYVKNMLL